MTPAQMTSVRSSSSPTARQASLEVGLDALRAGQQLVESGTALREVDDRELPAVGEGHQRLAVPAADDDDPLDARSLCEVVRQLVDVRLTGEVDRVVGEVGPRRAGPVPRWKRQPAIGAAIAHPAIGKAPACRAIVP
jgi:hypothetical protein